MEHRYHRTAIILWRREDHYIALLEIAPETMIGELVQFDSFKKNVILVFFNLKARIEA